MGSATAFLVWGLLPLLGTLGALAVGWVWDSRLPFECRTARVLPDLADFLPTAVANAALGVALGHILSCLRIGDRAGRAVASLFGISILGGAHLGLWTLWMTAAPIHDWWMVPMLACFAALAVTTIGILAAFVVGVVGEDGPNSNAVATFVAVLWVTAGALLALRGIAGLCHNALWALSGFEGAERALGLFPVRTPLRANPIFLSLGAGAICLGAQKHLRGPMPGLVLAVSVMSTLGSVLLVTDGCLWTGECMSSERFLAPVATAAVLILGAGMVVRLTTLQHGATTLWVASGGGLLIVLCAIGHASLTDMRQPLDSLSTAGMLSVNIMAYPLAVALGCLSLGLGLLRYRSNGLPLMGPGLAIMLVSGTAAFAVGIYSGCTARGWRLSLTAALGAAAVTFALATLVARLACSASTRDDQQSLSRPGRAGRRSVSALKWTGILGCLVGAGAVVLGFVWPRLQSNTGEKLRAEGALRGLLATAQGCTRPVRPTRAAISAARRRKSS